MSATAAAWLVLAAPLASCIVPVPCGRSPSRSASSSVGWRPSMPSSRPRRRRASVTAPIAAMKKTRVDISSVGGVLRKRPAPYSPSARSGVDSIGSASSISLVKMRSARL